MKVVVAVDSFKGSVDSRSAGEAVRAGVLSAAPAADVVVCEIADGGEGTVAAVLSARPGHEVPVETVDALGQPLTASYGVIREGAVVAAVIEAARTIGLALVQDVDSRLPPLASSYGLGVQLADALASGVDRVLIGLGGTVTTDGGTGLLGALGVGLAYSDGNQPLFGSNPLWDLSDVGSDALPDLHGVEVQVLSDVTNPLLGPAGAAAVFGPQKGATPDQVRRLDAQLATWAAALERLSGRPVASVPGAGAAGGIGAALIALGARVEPGFDRVAGLVGLDRAVVGADLVITGEGRIDPQTGMGKGPAGVARLAHEAGAMVVGLAGRVDRSAELGARFDATFSIHSRPRSLAEAVDPSTTLAELAATAEEVVRLLSRAMGGHRP